MSEYDEDEFVRPPDDTHVDQLLEDTRSDFEKEIDEALYLSYQDLKATEELSRNQEKQIIEQYNEETTRRKKTFETLLFDLQKIGKLDKEIKSIYEMIDPIIESYCYQYINGYELDQTTYSAIFTLLSKIRTDKNAVNMLKTILYVNGNELF